MPVEEARRLAALAERADAHDVRWCLAVLVESDEVTWHNFIPRLRRAHAVYPEVAERIHALADSPQATPGLRGALLDTIALLRLRANLALLALGVDAALAPVIAAVEGADVRLRSEALQGIPGYVDHVRWPDRYYEALFASCQKIVDDTVGTDRMRALAVLFETPVPSLAPAMRWYAATARDFRQRRAALWLLGQGHDREARPYVSHFLATPFPQDAQERAAWYRTVEELMRETAHCHRRAPSPTTRAWAAATVLILLDRLVDAAQVEGEPGIDTHWFRVSDALHAIRADMPPSAAPVLARWAQAHGRGGWQRRNAIVHYAPHAGAAAVDVLLEELAHTPTYCQGALVRELRILAPASRHAALAPVLRALFDAVPEQETGSYGDSDEQDALAAIAAALADVDPGAAAHIEARLAELGPVQQREVRWALRGLRPAGIASLLADAGAIAPLTPDDMARFDGDGHSVRSMLDSQKRLAVFNSRDDIDESTAVRVVKTLAGICVPAVELDAVTQDDAHVRFIHAGRVYEIRGVHDEGERGAAAAAFNAFLADIGHPRRVFEIGRDHGETDNDLGAFFCADPLRMPDAARQLGYPVALAGAA